MQALEEVREIMLQRKALWDLVKWKKESQGSTALMVEGARRVGKSTLVEEFAKNWYGSHILIDFAFAPPELIDIFESNAHDINSLLSYLAVFYGVSPKERDCLIIFDEVQFYPRARALLKPLVADGRFDYIATGSLISIKQNTQDILIPSEVEALELNPIDFEEFLLAIDETMLADFLKEIAVTPKQIPDAIHKKAMRKYREYLLVGGMPQAVVEYQKSKDFHKVDKVKRGILKLYREDITRFAKGYEGKVSAIFDELPSQLSKNEKKFTLASLGKDARTRTHEEAFFWLSDAKIINPCYNSTDPSVGLGLHKDGSTFKCYMADTGLLVTHAFADSSVSDNNLYKEILLGSLSINEGMIVENAIAQALHSRGHKLYFYSRHDRANRENNIEIDFLIVQRDKGKSRVSPIEVKSNTRYKTGSLDKFKRKFGTRAGQEIILHPGNVSASDNRVRLPLYLAAWL